MAHYRLQRLNLRGAWDGENKVRPWSSAYCHPHRALGPVCLDQGSDGEVRCVQEGHGRQAGPGLCLDPKILRTILVFSGTLNSGVKGRRKDPEASMRICSTLVETMGDPVPGRLKGLVI